MSEYKEPVEGNTKTYTHEVFFCIDKHGKILKFRLSFDEENLFLRCANIMKPCVDEFTKEIYYKNVQIKNIRVSDKAMEAVFEAQELRDVASY